MYWPAGHKNLGEAWDVVRDVPEWQGQARWLTPICNRGNILVANGRLAAVLDWGGVAIGDPAVDLIVAWNLLDKNTRPVFRDAVHVDEITWRRGRAWALSIALVAYPYYVETKPRAAQVALRQIQHVLADISAPDGAAWGR